MITSMTGFAAVTREDEVATVGVTLKAVNHRYLDVQIRAPLALAAMEGALRGLVQRRVARGRVEMSVSLQMRKPPAMEVVLNEPLVAALAATIDRARDAGLVSGPLAPGDLLRLPHGFTVRETVGTPGEAELDCVRSLVEQATESALEELEKMRRHEGFALQADLEARRAGLAESIGRVAEEADQGGAALRERLARRVAELGMGPGVDEALLAQEIVKLAARSDVSEELVRFRAHLDHWAALTASPEPCGRKLDFLLQEMNREINTIGSKAEGTRVGGLIVHMKAELEKMREQVQNVE